MGKTNLCETRFTVSQSLSRCERAHSHILRRRDQLVGTEEAIWTSHWTGFPTIPGTPNRHTFSDDYYVR